MFCLHVSCHPSNSLNYLIREMVFIEVLDGKLQLSLLPPFHGVLIDNIFLWVWVHLPNVHDKEYDQKPCTHGCGYMWKTRVFTKYVSWTERI